MALVSASSSYCAFRRGQAAARGPARDHCRHLNRFDSATVNPFHDEIACYATSNDRIVGVVFEDRCDHDFGFAAWVRESNGAFDDEPCNIRINLPSEEEATAALHEAMRDAATQAPLEAAVQ
jgi:hypothetical protein